MARRLSPALGLLLGLLLTACTKTDILNARQSGAWRIHRLTATSTPLNAPPTTQSVTDAGDVAFTDLAGDDNHVMLYADSLLPSHCLARISENPSGSGLAIGDYEYQWRNDPYAADRLVFFRGQGDLGLIAAATFTVTENKRDSQRWLYVEADAADHILFREEWELTRVK